MKACENGRAAAAKPPFDGLVVAAREGRVLQVLGDAITVKAGPEDTAGGYSVLEQVSPPGGGAPLHTHATEDEILTVLDGQLELQLGEKTMLAGPGTTAVLPRGVAHGFRNVGAGPSRVFVVVAPGSFVRFFEEIDALSQRQEMTPPEATRIAAGHGLQIHPPPAAAEVPAADDAVAAGR